MFREIALVCIACSFLTVHGSRLKYPDFHKDDLSKSQHYEEGRHNPQFDYEAFLGKQKAQEWQKLPANEVKQKLKKLFPKIDTNKDKKVSIDELYEWIEQHMKKHVLHGASLKMRDMDTNKDGKVSWEEYKALEFPPSIEEGLPPQSLAEYRELQARDKRKFDFADTDDDGELSREEFSLFLHPEESKRMTSYIIQDNLDAFDTNKDGKVSLNEFLGDGDKLKSDPQSVQSLSRTFNKELDGNHDGYLDFSEIQKWILPGMDQDPIEKEANHLMRLGDDDKNKSLSMEELVRHYRDFGGSRVTKYGDLLKEEL